MSGVGVPPCKCCQGCTGICDDIPTLTFTADASTDKLTVTHNFNDDDQVRVLSSDALPGGLSPNTPYYVIVVDSTNIKLSATAGGSAIDITNAGSGTHEITDTTFIEDQWDNIYGFGTDWQYQDIGDGVPPFTSIENDNGMCVFRIKNPSDDTSANDSMYIWREYTLPTGDGAIIELSARFWTLPITIGGSPTELTQCAVGINNFGTTAQNSVIMLRHSVDDHRYSYRSDAGTTASNVSKTVDEGERLTLKMTEDSSGNYDVHGYQSYGGSDTDLINITGEAFTMPSTVELGTYVAEAGKIACWWCRLREGT